MATKKAAPRVTIHPTIGDFRDAYLGEIASISRLAVSRLKDDKIDARMTPARQADQLRQAAYDLEPEMVGVITKARAYLFDAIETLGRDDE